MRVNQEFTDENFIIKSRAFSNIGFIKHGFTNRNGGVSEGNFSSCNLGLNTKDKKENVIENYKISAKRIGFDAGRLVLTHQVHSDIILTVKENDCGKQMLCESDGLITNCRNVPIGVFTADCTPILLCDVEKKVVAAVHSGWKGALLEIGKKAAKKMCDEFGSNPQNIMVAIGPSIKKCHFEVKNDVYGAFCEKFGIELLSKFCEKKSDSYYIDTDAINKASLVSLGVPEENIKICPTCTFCESDRFFSHRASGGQTGRQCAFITII